jgi:hypothetical protein
MRRLATVFVLAAVMMVMMASAALAHVHGITPLLELDCKVDNSITGGNRTDDTPAGADNGGPIAGLIPSTVGNASLTPFVDGGFDAANNDVCPG